MVPRPTSQPVCHGQCRGTLVAVVPDVLSVRFVIALICMLAFYAGYNSAAVSSAEIKVFGVTGSTRTSHIDIYGNDVDDAVGDYRIDPRGELYEDHSPDTALLKLGSPST
jgi:hypothetical protein